MRIIATNPADFEFAFVVLMLFSILRAFLVEEQKIVKKMTMSKA